VVRAKVLQVYRKETNPLNLVAITDGTRTIFNRLLAWLTELGWADFRVTDYSSIERWWEVVLSAYLLIMTGVTQLRRK